MKTTLQTLVDKTIERLDWDVPNWAWTNEKKIITKCIKEAYMAGREEVMKEVKKLETDSYTLEGAYTNEVISKIFNKFNKL